MDARDTSKMLCFWRGSQQLVSLLQVGKTFFEGLLEVMLELPPGKRHRVLTDATKFPWPLQPPELLPAGPAVCGTERVNRDEEIIFTADCSAMGQQRC